MQNILVLEDDVRLLETLGGILSTRFKVHKANSLKDAAKILSSQHCDAILSDFFLADGDGFALLNLVQTISPRPKLIFMTAYAEKEMAIKLLNHKVDGLLEKPFEYMNLLDLLNKELAAPGLNSIDSLTLNPFRKSLQVGDAFIELTDIEFKILSYLVSKQEKWITRKDLLDYIWGNAATSRNTLDTHLSNMKRKVPHLRTSLKVVRSRGYCYSPAATQTTSG